MDLDRQAREILAMQRRKVIIRAGYTRQDIADVCGVSGVTIWRWEHGYMTKAGSRDGFLKYHLILYILRRHYMLDYKPCPTFVMLCKYYT